MIHRKAPAATVKDRENRKSNLLLLVCYQPVATCTLVIVSEVNLA